jgi:hypothetical protein
MHPTSTIVAAAVAAVLCGACSSPSASAPASPSAPPRAALGDPAVGDPSPPSIAPAGSVLAGAGAGDPSPIAGAGGGAGVAPAGAPDAGANPGGGGGGAGGVDPGSPAPAAPGVAPACVYVARPAAFWVAHACFAPLPLRVGLYTNLTTPDVLAAYLVEPPVGDIAPALGEVLALAKLNLMVFGGGCAPAADWDGDGVPESVDALLAIGDGVYIEGTDLERARATSTIATLLAAGAKLEAPPLCDDEPCDCGH